MTDPARLAGTTGSLVTAVLDVAGQLGYPAIVLPSGEVIAVCGPWVAVGVT